MSPKPVSNQPVEVAPDVHAPGHPGELTQIIDPELVDVVIEDTGAAPPRARVIFLRAARTCQGAVNLVISAVMGVPELVQENGTMRVGTWEAATS